MAVSGADCRAAGHAAAGRGLCAEPGDVRFHLRHRRPGHDAAGGLHRPDFPRPCRLFRGGCLCLVRTGGSGRPFSGGVFCGWRNRGNCRHPDRLAGAAGEGCVPGDGHAFVCVYRRGSHRSLEQRDARKPRHDGAGRQHLRRQAGKHDRHLLPVRGNVLAGGAGHFECAALAHRAGAQRAARQRCGG